MAKKGKLIAALERQQGRNIRLEQQRAHEKIAAKKRAGKEAPTGDLGQNETEPTAISKLNQDIVPDEINEESDIGSSTYGATHEDEPLSDEDEDSQVGGIPFSDIESLASEEKADVVPFQRLTINNTAALLKAHKSISADKSAPFSTYQIVTGSVQTEVTDVNDDLGRELAFYKQCLEAAREGRLRLKKEGVTFTRPKDYFAEMVKTDEHMGKVRDKMTEKETDKKAAAEARKLRDLKKFGKQVQVAKLQEREKAKRDTLEKINQLKRKRNTANESTREEEMFDVALEDAGKPTKTRVGTRSKGVMGPNPKRQRKNEKYGHGGKRRFSKSGDAVSSADMSQFSVKKMKKSSPKASKRLGKSRRAKLS